MVMTSDETQVLANWPMSHAKRLKPFVSNSVSEIQQKLDPDQGDMYQGSNTTLTTQQEVWTGLDLRNLCAESRWFQGPAFLHWPSENRLSLSDCSEEDKQELAKIHLTFNASSPYLCLASRGFRGFLPGADC